MVRRNAAARTLVRLSFACALIAGCLPCHAQLCGTMHPMESNPGWPGAATGLSADGAVAAGLIQGSGHWTYRAARWDVNGAVVDMSMEVGNSQAIDVSGDGLSIVGWSQVAAGSSSIWRPFRWRADGGVLLLPIEHAVASASSYDGDRVACHTVVGGSQNAYLWSEFEGVRHLGTLGGTEAVAIGISANGDVVVGRAKDSSGRSRAFRWTETTGMQDLGTLGGQESYATAASEDGSIIVGGSSNAAGQWRAFRWEAGTMTDVAPDNSVATDVSNDGSVIVGAVYSDSPSLTRAFRWTETSDWIDMGSLGGSVTSAWAVSADGSVVVGRSNDSTSLERPFRWIGEPTPADYNGDLYLEVVDFLDFVDDFGACQGMPAPCGQFGDPDLNGDTITDIVDLLDFLDAFGRGC